MKTFRIIKTFAVISIIILLAACGPKLKDQTDWKLDSFSYTDQNGKPFGLSDLKGKVWVTDFIFTSCQTVCPPLTANMTRLQKMIKDEGIKNVEFVSFSVDPTVDTPSKMKEFMSRYDMDQSKWHFLTGYTQEEIQNFGKKNFKTLIDKPESSDQVIHGTRFYLVDQNGIVVKSYSGLQNTPYEEIIGDIKRIQ
ncbi:SCO family protein [Ectobacillus funiculus]|uniref:SCO family protein n=1 Tax=Ectobacillus funiculus TaxID=137993 RepID=A0ABV5WFI6_9BACI